MEHSKSNTDFSNPEVKGLLYVYKQAIKNVPLLRYSWILIAAICILSIAAYFKLKNSDVFFYALLVIGISVLGFLFSYLFKARDRFIKLLFYLLLLSLVLTSATLVLGFGAFIIWEKPSFYQKLFPKEDEKSGKDSKGDTTQVDSDTFKKRNDTVLQPVQRVDETADSSIQLPPEILNGEIKTNASIKCSADGHPPFTSERNEWFPLPYNAGPNMEYAGQTKCYAFTNASTTIRINNRNKLSWSLDITNKLGGMCGADNTGGEGVVIPEYRTSIKLPSTQKRTSWTLDLRAKGSEGTGLSTVYVIGNGVDTSFTFDRTGRIEKLILKGLKSGEYRLELTMPKLEQGCYGAYPGTEGTKTFYSSLSIDINRIE